jgi:putative oxidoreductase
MTTSTANSSIAAQNESRLIIPQLASFYEYTPGLSWLIVRLTAGGMLLVHGIMKAMPMAEKGLAATLEAFAANVLARRGIEPALPLAYVVFFLETIGAVCVMLGLFTRFFAAALAIQFAIITFVAHWAAGFACSGASSCSRSRCAGAAPIRSTADSAGSCSVPAFRNNPSRLHGSNDCGRPQVVIHAD